MMTHWITSGVEGGPLLTKRSPGEDLVESNRRHRELVALARLEGDRLITIWQFPGLQNALVTTRRWGESDEDVRRRHLAGLPFH